MLKKKLNYVLEHGKLPTAKPKITQEQISQSNLMRSNVQNWLDMPLAQFLRTKPPFHAKHGMVYKLLKTSPQRLHDSTLCSHDVAFWLRDHKHPTAATWVLKLAGPTVGQVSRNQVLQWLQNSNRNKDKQLFYQWTRKWGFEDSSATKAIMADPSTVVEARELYKGFNGDKQVYGNKLLDRLARRGVEAEGLYAFFRTLNKDVVTFQIMLSAMIQHAELRKYLAVVWELAERQNANNNIKIDDKLRETYDRVVRLDKSQKRASN